MGEGVERERMGEGKEGGSEEKWRENEAELYRASDTRWRWYWYSCLPQIDSMLHVDWRESRWWSWSGSDRLGGGVCCTAVSPIGLRLCVCVRYHVTTYA